LVLQLFLKEKLPKRTLRRDIAFGTKAVSLLAFLFFRRFFSLAQREKAAKKTQQNEPLAYSLRLLG
jgi:hypothetical protein